MSLFVVLPLVWHVYWVKESSVLQTKVIPLQAPSFSKHCFKDEHNHAVMTGHGKSYEDLRYAETHSGRWWYEQQWWNSVFCERKPLLMLILTRWSSGWWTWKFFQPWWSCYNMCCLYILRRCLAIVWTHGPEIWLAVIAQVWMRFLYRLLFVHVYERSWLQKWRKTVRNGLGYS